METDLIDAIPVPAVMILPDDSLGVMNAPFQGLFPVARQGRSYATVLRQPDLVMMVERQRAGLTSAPASIRLTGRGEGTFKVSGALLDQGQVLICLQDMNETASAIAMRRNFVADLGHELRTPLTAMSGILETCDGDAAALAHFLPMMAREVDRMSRLVTDLMALSRVETNERRKPDAEVNIAVVINEACARMGTLADKLGAKIAVDCPAEPPPLLGDHDQMVRALSNLVENSLRYGKPGGLVQVSCSVEKAGFQSETEMVAIKVSDDGPGVASHHIPRLTERFYRVDDHRSRETGGSGLGLAIVKHIVNRHRGRMKFDSTPGQGTTVTLTFPHGVQKP